MKTHGLAALSEIDRELRRGERVLIATDFDGTLCPIEESPGKVHLPASTREILRQITCTDGMHLAILSGRSLADLMQRVFLTATFAGNHGLEMHGHGLNFEHPEARRLRPELASACTALAACAARWEGAWVEDKYLSATLHYRSVDPRCQHDLLVRARQTLAPFSKTLAMRGGSKALEIRPRVDWDKGAALRHIQERGGPFDVTICLGDDRTDETMFTANTRGYSLKVGAPIATSADYYLRDPGEVAVFLSHVLAVQASRISDPAAEGSAGLTFAAG